MTRVWRAGAGGQPVRSLPELQSILLARRGIPEAAAASFFSPDYAASIHDPEQLSGVKAAVARLRQAKRRGERVLVYGDYDADGVTATAILVTTLRALGISVTPYLPHRMDDGYALNQTVLQPLLPEFDILIAADCGISNQAEIAWLKTQGKDVIIVDHHTLPDVLPPANAILHPALDDYPFPFLSGAGVAWKLATALTGDGAEALDLAMLGTVADVVSLTGENRAIVKFGLQRLSRTKRIGLSALGAACRLPAGALRAEDIAFRVIPCLNAAGRMDHPQRALDVLLTQESSQAARFVRELTTLNTQRQTLTRRIMAEAETQVDLALPFVFLVDTAWWAGIVGLAAGRMADKFKRPAIVIGGNGQEPVGAVGSARSPRGSNVLQLLETGRQHLLKLGGHARAAGFSLPAENIPRFKEALLAAPGSREKPTETVPTAEALLDHSLLSWDLLELVEAFAPFGEGNPKPLFAAQNVEVLDRRGVGKTGEHVKFVLGAAFEPIEAIGFGLAKAAHSIRERADILFGIEVNEYGGRRRLQLALKDIARAGQIQVQQEDESDLIQ